MAYRSISTNGTAATGLIVTAPSGIVDGDILVAFAITDHAADANPTWPAGFTAVTGTPVSDTADAQTLFIATKKAASESGSYTITHASQAMIGGIAVFSGRDGTNYLHKSSVGSSSIANASPWTVTTASFASSTSVAGCDMFFVCGHDVTNGSANPVTTPPSGYTLRAEVPGVGGFKHVAAATKNNEASGASGALSAIGTSATFASGWGAVALALAPPNNQIVGTAVATVVGSGLGVNFYVSTSGVGSGPGTIDAPWSLAYALSGAGAQIASGATINLRAGTYTGDWNWSLSGSATHQVTFQPYNATPSTPSTTEYVLLDSTTSATDSPIITGNYLTIKGIAVQFTGSTVRTSTDGPHSGSYSNPTDIGNRWHKSFRDQGHHNKIINCVVHDTGDGITSQNTDTCYAGEYNGNIVYNGGWNGPDRGHGHSHYFQNENPLGKSVIDTVSYGFFSSLMKFAGSGAASCWHFTVNGCAAFNAGATPGTTGGPDFNMHVEGGGDLGHIGNSTFDKCSFYANDGNAGSPPFRLGVAGDPNAKPFAITNSIWQGQASFNECDTYTVTGNKGTIGATDVGGIRLFGLRLGSGQSYAAHRFDSNAWAFLDADLPFFGVTGGTGTTYRFGPWQAATGYEPNGSLTNAVTFTGSDIVYRANQYETGRGFVYCWNWDGAATLPLDLSKVGLVNGNSYAVWHIYSVDRPYPSTGTAVTTGTYGGGTVSIGQTGYTAPVPIGWAGANPPSASPYFNVFLVMKT